MKADGIESNIYKIVTKGAEMQITAAKENVELIRLHLNLGRRDSGWSNIVQSGYGSRLVRHITKLGSKDEMEHKQKTEEINAGQKNIILNGLTDLYVHLYVAENN